MSEPILPGPLTPLAPVATPTAIVNATCRNRNPRSGGSKASFCCGKLGKLASLLALADNPDLYRLADTLPVLNSEAGRSALYPNWLFHVVLGGATFYGSPGSVINELLSDVAWREILARAGKHRSGDIVDGEPVTADRLSGLTQPPSRYHWGHWISSVEEYIVDVDGPWQREFRRLMLEQAVNQGLLLPFAPFSTTTPPLSQLVHSDGKVMNSPARRVPDRDTGKTSTAARGADPAGISQEVVDTVTGEVSRVRVDRGAGWHTEGGDEKVKVWGVKFAHLSTRSEHRGGRVILDVRPVDAESGGEMAVVMAMLRAACADPRAAIHGLVCDGAMRGVHINEILVSGRHAISPSIAASNPKKYRKAGPGRIEKTYPLGPVSHKPNGGGPCTHVLVAEGGHIVESHDADDGTSIYTRLKVIKVERILRPDHWDWYKVVEIDCPEQPFQHRVSLTPRKPRPGKVAPLNVGEYIRQVPADTYEYGLTYPRRSDAESLNRQWETAFNISRLPAWTLSRQTALMLGGALAFNSVSRELHRRRTESEQQEREAQEQQTEERDTEE